jgi:hypothetical protein
MCDQVKWAIGMTAFVVLDVHPNQPNKVIREVELIDNLGKGVWRGRWDEIADDAEIKSCDLAFYERDLSPTMEGALHEIITDLTAEILNENREWYQQTKLEKD